MPTAKPRINLTLNQGLYDLLTDYARALGVSRSAAAVALIETGWNDMLDVVQKRAELDRAAAKTAASVPLATLKTQLDRL
jgi:hypothetical protein